jgi:thioredoxin 1
MSAAFPDVSFVTVDIDALDDLILDELDVETVPTFLLMKNGKEVTRVVGVAHKRPARPLAAAIRRHLCS